MPKSIKIPDARPQPHAQQNNVITSALKNPTTLKTVTGQALLFKNSGPQKKHKNSDIAPKKIFILRLYHDVQ